MEWQNFLYYFSFLNVGNGVDSPSYLKVFRGLVTGLLFKEFYILNFIKIHLYLQFDPYTTFYDF